MNEVTKLYENAEPNRDCNLYKHFTECPMKHTQCEDCENFVYPPFTAEKQLLLIQWLAKTRPIHITFLIDKWVIEGMVRYGKRYDTFEDALSGYINEIWQDLTEEERTQMKEILE